MSSTDLAALSSYAEMVETLHKQFTPHEKQLQPARDLFFGGVKLMFLCLGRRFGKSALMCYFAVRWALIRPNSKIYIVGPQLNTQREIILSSGLLAGIAPRKYMAGEINKTEGRLNFTNGSFIRIMGADDPETLRGLRCSLLLVDEIKDVKREVLDIMGPTLIDEDAPMIIAGTPPEVAEHPFWDLVKEYQQNPEARYYHGTSYDNPHLPKERIDLERAKFIKRGDGDVFEREFMARYVPGGKRAIFSMLTDQHFIPYPQLYARIHRNLHQWQFYCTMDPGTASCFAVALHAVNPYKGLVYQMDEVYAVQQNETSIGKIWPRVFKLMQELYEPDLYTDDAQWTITVDEAAVWARNELLDQFHLASFPTRKASNKKSDGISLLKDVLRTKKMLFSDRCVETRKEMMGYMLDKQGNFIKKNDHLIDCNRYMLAAANYTFNETDPPALLLPTPEDERRRAFSVEEDFNSLFGDNEGYLSDLLD